MATESRNQIYYSFILRRQFEILCPKHKRSKATVRFNNNILKGYKNGVWNRKMFIHKHRRRKEKITW